MTKDELTAMAREWRRSEAEDAPYDGQEERLAKLLLHVQDTALELAAARLTHRATSEQVNANRGGLTRDGKTARRLYAVTVLGEEADWIRRLRQS